MEIRNWVYEDVYAVAALEKECFRDPWTYGMLAETFFNSAAITLVAVEEGKIAGYAFAVKGVEDADVANIAVAPQFRRRGIAQALLKALEERAAAADVQRLFLEVRVSNAPAMLLYLKNGFTGSYVRPRYYADGEDALVMVKPVAR